MTIVDYCILTKPLNLVYFKKGSKGNFYMIKTWLSL